MPVPPKIDLGYTDIDTLERVALHKSKKCRKGLLAGFKVVSFPATLIVQGHGLDPHAVLRVLSAIASE
jgi:hypothetical protein